MQKKLISARGSNIVSSTYTNLTTGLPFCIRVVTKQPQGLGEYYFIETLNEQNDHEVTDNRA